MTSEMEWTRKYKQALLERDRSQLKHRIEEAKDAMAARRCTLDRESHELQIIDRAMDILATLRESSAGEHS